MRAVSIVRVGIGHDTHRLVEGRPLILGGVRVEFERGLAGHSDADVVLHSVADALLGAAALGDIGELFPDTDPEWEGLDSAVLLEAVRGRVAEAGWSPVNCDIIIHAERPKLSAYKPAIRAGVARLLGLPESAVNVKAKTGERVGHLGRGEAIACQAVVLCESLRP
jgi:2-C-methyl-D-erythritol 2,4-cyclodiphosphate synthase